MLNMVDDSYGGTDQAIANATNGNIGSYRSNILGASVNKAKSRFSAYNNINDINRAEQARLNEDRAIAMREETTLYNREQDLEAMDKAVYDDAKRKYRTAAYEGLGKIGETIFQTNQLEDQSSYNIWGSKKRTEEEKAATKAARKARRNK